MGHDHLETKRRKRNGRDPEGRQAPSWKNSKKLSRYVHRTADPTGTSVGKESNLSTATPSSNGDNILDDGGELVKRTGTTLWPVKTVI